MEEQRLEGHYTAESVELREIIHLLMRWWWKIILMMALFAGAAFYYTQQTYIPTYIAKASMVVNSKQVKIVGTEVVVANDIAMAQKLVNTYSMILKSDRVMDLVSQDLALNIDPDIMRKSIKVSTTKDTEVLNVEVEYGDAETAAGIANSIMKVAPEAISETVEVGSVKVVDFARVPEEPEPPQTARNTGIGGFLGAMLAAGLAFLRRYLNTKINNPDDIRERIGLPLLGEIPYIKIKKSKKNPVSPLVTSDWVDTGFKESYAALRTNFRYLAGVSGAKKILITSAMDSEGKTTVAINLCLLLAHSGKRVLLIESDMRKPTVHRKMNLKGMRKKGLSAVLAGAGEASDCIVPLQGAGFDFLPSGAIPANPSELLDSDRMSSVLTQLEGSYDYIIMDAPPVHLVADATILAKVTDGVIFVILQGRVNSDLIIASKDSLTGVGARIIGCVLNGIRFKEAGSRYKYRYYRRYYGGYYQQLASGTSGTENLVDFSSRQDGNKRGPEGNAERSPEGRILYHSDPIPNREATEKN